MLRIGKVEYVLLGREGDYVRYRIPGISGDMEYLATPEEFELACFLQGLGSDLRAEIVPLIQRYVARELEEVDTSDSAPC